MPSLLIVSHQPSPNTRRITDAVEQAARSVSDGDLNIVSLTPAEAAAEHVQACDAIILGTTENFGYMAGALKDFFERIYYPCLETKQGLPYALFVKAGQDGRGAVSSIEPIVTGLRWKRVLAPLVMTGEFQEKWLGACEELGATVAAGVEAGLY